MAIYLQNPNINAKSMYLARLPEPINNQVYEPQRLRVLKDSRAILTCDNQSRSSGDPFNFRCTLAAMVQNINRVGITSIEVSSPANCVNNGNNTLVLVVTAGAFIGTHVITLVNGAYTDGGTLAAMINALTAAFGVFCGYSPLTGKLFITSADLFFINPTCSFIVFGFDCYGFSPSSVPTFVYVGGVCHLMSSRYYAVTSDDMTQYEKNTSSDSSHNSKIVFIIYATNWAKNPFEIILPANDSSSITWLAFEPQTQLTQLSFKIRDRFGRDPSLYADSIETFICCVSVMTVV